MLGPFAAGSLHADIHPGELVICDQLIDRTWGRPDTFFDGPVLGHVAFADPYCSELGDVLARAAADTGALAHRSGTVMVIQGPRFSTRAESRWFRSAGCDVIDVDGNPPEAVLARELGICYAGLAQITDYDTGLEGDASIEPVTMEAAFAVLEASVEHTRHLLMKAIPAIPRRPRAHAPRASPEGRSPRRSTPAAVPVGAGLPGRPNGCKAAAVPVGAGLPGRPGAPRQRPPLGRPPGPAEGLRASGRRPPGLAEGPG